jgi:hypothetical protein
MTSLKQIEANRRNALKSTGPRSKEGKQRASRNAFRHGLTTETVLDPLEDPEDYKLFEEAIAAEYEAESAVERELVLRLASLLWRLRRTSLIETGLFEAAERTKSQISTPPLLRLLKRTTDVRSNQLAVSSTAQSSADVDRAALEISRDAQQEVVKCFRRLAKMDNGILERLNRYELALWRQARQTIFVLELLRWRIHRARAPSRSHHISIGASWAKRADD